MFTCNKCDISLGCKHQVYGVGVQSDLMFIGENPGHKEDRLNKPFVGASGKLLDEYFDMCGFDRDYMYITNIVKCKTPGNRSPSDLEIANCRPYLINEIIANKPKIIVTLGKTAFEGLFKPNRLYNFTKIVDKWFTWHEIRCIAMLHPSYVLRKPEIKDAYREGFKHIADAYRSIHPYHKVNY